MNKQDTNNKGVTNAHDEKFQEHLANGDEEFGDNEQQSQSATGSSSGSVGSSTTSMAEFRNFHSFTEQQTP